MAKGAKGKGLGPGLGGAEGAVGAEGAKGGGEEGKGRFVAVSLGLSPGVRPWRADWRQRVHRKVPVGGSYSAGV